MVRESAAHPRVHALAQAQANHQSVNQPIINQSINQSLQCTKGATEAHRPPTDLRASFDELEGEELSALLVLCQDHHPKGAAVEHLDLRSRAGLGFRV